MIKNLVLAMAASSSQSCHSQNQSPISRCYADLSLSGGRDEGSSGSDEGAARLKLVCRADAEAFDSCRATLLRLPDSSLARSRSRCFRRLRSESPFSCAARRNFLAEERRFAPRYSSSCTSHCCSVSVGCRAATYPVSASISRTLPARLCRFKRSFRTFLPVPFESRPSACRADSRRLEFERKSCICSEWVDCLPCLRSGKIR